MLILRRARLWQETDPASMDLLNGPQGEGAYRFKDEVRCVFEERDPAFPIGGHTKKFPCVDASKTRLKVKYDPSQNTEIFGETAATRLFWALGFYAERMYSVRLACGNCPKDPFVSDAPPRAERIFEPVTLQKRLKGTEILSGEMEGWTFDELDLVEEARGGASKAQVDALKLLAVFVNHGDNTHNQQRILCPEEDPRCPRPILYVTDLGGTFGGKGYFTSLRNWTKKARIWKDPSACVADFEGMSPGYRDPASARRDAPSSPDSLGASRRVRCGTSSPEPASTSSTASSFPCPARTGRPGKRRSRIGSGCSWTRGARSSKPSVSRDGAAAVPRPRPPRSEGGSLPSGPGPPRPGTRGALPCRIQPLGGFLRPDALLTRLERRCSTRAPRTALPTLRERRVALQDGGPLAAGGPLRLAYVSAGEADEKRSYWPQAKGKPYLVESNPNWPEAHRVDIRSDAWRRLLLKEVVPKALAKGYDGVFLDTLDTAEYLQSRDTAAYAGSMDAAKGLVEALRAQYPDKLILLNNALPLLEGLADAADGVVVEDLYTRCDPHAKACVPTPEDVSAAKEETLSRWKERTGKPVFRLLFSGLRERDSPPLRKAARRCLKNGFFPYLALPSLMSLGRVAPGSR